MSKTATATEKTQMPEKTEKPEKLDKPTSQYTAEDIVRMEGLEGIRKRPGMYIGGPTIEGLHHLVYEIVSNSIDEALAGRCNVISVMLNTDGSCAVAGSRFSRTSWAVMVAAQSARRSFPVFGTRIAIHRTPQ